MWPFRAEIVHKVECPDLAAAIRELADAKRYDARVRGGIVVKRLKPDVPEDPEWGQFEEGNPDLGESEMLHLRWARSVLTGREPADGERRVEAMRVYAAAQEVLGVPEIADARLVPGRSGRSE